MPFSASATMRPLSSSLMAEAVAVPSSLIATIELLPGTRARQSVIEGERIRELCDPLLQRKNVGLGLECRRDDFGDLGELGVAESARGEGGSADANTRRRHRRSRVEWHSVAVDGDTDRVQDVFGVLAVDGGLAQVDENEVHIGAAGEDVDSSGLHVRSHQTLREDLRAANGALLAILEFGLSSEFERRRLGRDDVHERATLLAREDVRVDLLLQLEIVRQDEPRAR